MQYIAEQIREFVVSEFGIEPETVETDTPLFSSGLLDSFSLVDLITFVESVAGRKFRIVDVNLENLDSIEKIISYIERSGG